MTDLPLVTTKEIAEIFGRNPKFFYNCMERAKPFTRGVHYIQEGRRQPIKWDLTKTIAAYLENQSSGACKLSR